MFGQGVLRLGLLLLMTVNPAAAQAACTDKCSLECVNNTRNFVNCYTLCQARCHDTNKADNKVGNKADNKSLPEKTYQTQPAKQYAALALSPATLQYGYAFGKNSEAEARAAALESCVKAAGVTNDCAMQLRFYNACGSLALKSGSNKHDGAWGTDWASSRTSAEKTALKLCQDIAGDGCRTEITFCAWR